MTEAQSRPLGGVSYYTMLFSSSAYDSVLASVLSVLYSRSFLLSPVSSVSINSSHCSYGLAGLVQNSQEYMHQMRTTLITAEVRPPEMSLQARDDVIFFYLRSSRVHHVS